MSTTDADGHQGSNRSNAKCLCNSVGQTEAENTRGGYIVSMEEIIHKLNTEDKSLRNIRRTLGFSQIIQKDLIPMIIHVQDNTELFEQAIRLLTSLTIPVECLLSTSIATASEQIIVDELNSFLCGAKEAFVDSKATKAILDYMKRIDEHHMTKGDCDALNSCLMLLRNILHIPERSTIALTNGGPSSVQNQILWNMFSQGLDKLLLQLMTYKQSEFWAVTMIQLIALIYKDQNVGTLQRLLGNWLESSPSDSSEDDDDDDDESNTSSPPPPRNSGSGCSTSASTSEITSSDSSSDTNCKNKNSNINSSHRRNSSSNVVGGLHQNAPDSPVSQQPPPKERKVSKHFQERNGLGFAKPNATKKTEDDVISKTGSDSSGGSSSNNNSGTSGSDYGYHTQEKHENTSSTDDGGGGQQQQHRSGADKKVLTRMKCGGGTPIRQHHVKTPYCPTMTDKNEMRKRKLSLRQKDNVERLNRAWKLRVKGLKFVPNDDDISNLLTDFTVDFLLKGYSGLVVDLKAQLMLNTKIQLDQSHFLWLVTYFLKFANQMELELHLLSPVLSCDIVSYLTYEGVNTCEQLEKACLEKSSDLKPQLRRIHLVVTAIKEFIHTLETFSKCGSVSSEDAIEIQRVQDQICGLQDLRQLFLLLIRYYNPAIQNVQYLQDLVVTNHAFLMLIERVAKSDKNGAVAKTFDMSEHIKQFATFDVMKQYGTVLEAFQINSQSINNCLFTMFHHVVGDMHSPESLFQPVILRCFLKIWENEYKVVDEWMDVMEYVIQKFIASTNKQGDRRASSSSSSSTSNTKSSESETTEPRTDNEQDFKNLYFKFLQCELDSDPIGKLMELTSAAEPGLKKSRNQIVQQLLAANLITKSRSAELLLEATDQGASITTNAFPIDVLAGSQRVTNDEIVDVTAAVCREGHRRHLLWLQRLLLDACYVKLDQHKGKNRETIPPEPITLNYSMKRQSIPIVPYSEEQERALQCGSFNQLLQRLGFHLAVDVDNIFPRIPCFWTADVLFTVARRLGPITSDMLKFDPNRLRKTTELTYPEELPTFLLAPPDFEEKKTRTDFIDCLKNNVGQQLKVPSSSGGLNWSSDQVKHHNNRHQSIMSFATPLLIDGANNMAIKTKMEETSDWVDGTTAASDQPSCTSSSVTATDTDTDSRDTSMRSEASSPSSGSSMETTDPSQQRRRRRHSRDAKQSHVRHTTAGSTETRFDSSNGTNSDTSMDFCDQDVS